MAQRLNILITGCNGFIGKYLSAALSYHSDLKCHVTGVDPNELELAATSPIFDEYHKADAGSFIKLLNDGHQLKNLFPEKIKYDVIIHLGTISRSGIFDEYPEDSISSDTLALLSILAYCRFHPETKMVYLSTMGAGTSTKPYHTLKLNAECLITSYIQQYGINAAIVKVDKVFGPGENDFAQYNSLLRVCKDAKLNDTAITVHGDGGQTHDWVHVTKVAEGIISVIQDHFLHKKPLRNAFQIFSGIRRDVDSIVWAFQPYTVHYDKTKPAQRFKEPVYNIDQLPFALRRQHDLGVPHIDVLEYIDAWKEDNCPN